MSCDRDCAGGESPGGGRMPSFHPSRTPRRQNPLGTPPPPRRGQFLIPDVRRQPQMPRSPRPWQRQRTAPMPQRRPPPNVTYAMGSPQLNQNNSIQNQQPIAGRDDLANSIMDDIGDGGIWNEASAMSLADYQENVSADDEESCPPCDELDDVTPELYNQSPPMLNISAEGPPRFNISNETPPPLYQTPPRLNISDETAPSFYPSTPRSNISAATPPYFNISDETPPSFEESGCPPCDEESSLGLLDSNQMQDNALDVSAIAEGPSNISVYDAEELNITTAPRNADWDIPRNRIWQTISSSLDETEQNEEDEFINFVTGLQNQRRSFFQSSFD